MERLVSRDLAAVYHRWQPDDGTNYELIVLADPHGGWRLWWRNGRSSRKGQAPVISSYWTDCLSFGNLRDQLKKSMRLLPYDAEALAVFLAEKGHCATTAAGIRGEVRSFPVRCVRL